MNTSIFLDTYVLQQDMRVRLPRAILSNMRVEKGKTKFDIYYNPLDNALVLRIHDDNSKNVTEKNQMWDDDNSLVMNQ